MSNVWFDANRLVPNNRSFSTVRDRQRAPIDLLSHWVAKSQCYKRALESCLGSARFPKIEGDIDERIAEAKNAFSHGAVGANADADDGAAAVQITPDRFRALMARSTAARNLRRAVPGPAAQAPQPAADDDNEG